MRILLADDNQFVRRGIAGILAQEEDWVLCGEASNSQEAIEKTSELHPDLVLLDSPKQPQANSNDAKFSNLLVRPVYLLRLPTISADSTPDFRTARQ
jgi:DNA-binding NarL/FixJ family response regulator